MQPHRIARGTGPVTALALLRVAGRLTLARAGADGISLLDVETGGLVGHLDGGRSAPVRTLSVVTDGRDAPALLAAGGVDGVVRLWDAARQEPVARVAIGNGSVAALTTLDAPQGSLVAAVCSRQVRLWDWRRERVRDLALAGAPTSALCPLRIGRQALLVAGHVGGDVRLWDPDQPGAPVRVIAAAHDGTVRALTPFRMGGAEWLASGGPDRTIRIWQFSDLLADPLTVDALRTRGTVRQLAALAHHDGDLLVSASAAGLTDLWRPDPSHPAHLRAFDGHRGEVWSVACTRDGGRTVVASGDISGGIRLTDLRDDVEEPTTVSLRVAPASPIWSLAALPGRAGGLLASAGVDGAVGMVGPGASVLRTAPTGHDGTVRAVAAGPDPNRPALISGGVDGTIRAWDPVTGAARASVMHGRGEVWALAPLRLNGADLVVSGGADGVVRLSPLDGADTTAETLAEEAGEITGLTVVPAPRRPRIACAGTTGVRLIDLAPRRAVQQICTMPTSAVTTVTCRDRTLVVCARLDGDVVLFDPVTRQLAATLPTPEIPAQVCALTVVPRGGEQWIVGGCHDGRLLIWDADTATLRTEIAGAHLGAVRAVVALDRDGAAQLGSAGDDGQLRRWALTGPAPRLVDELRPGSGPPGPPDGPERADRLGRAALVAGLHELLTDPGTTPPMVIGVHGPSGHGRTSVLSQLRGQLDRTQPAPGWTDPPSPTHELTSAPGRAPARGWRGLRQRWQGGPVRTRLTRWWAWRQLERGSEPAGRLPYRIRPRRRGPGAASADGPAQPITVWFSPARYAGPEHIWAGLTRELLTAVTRRLPAAQRERLWFDLNLRRTDPARLRPRLLWQPVARLVANLVLLALTTVTAVALVGSATGRRVPPSVTLGAIGAAVIVLGLVTVARFGCRHIRGELPPGVLDGPSPSGIAPPHGSNGPTDRDPLRHSPTGYLYLLQHDVPEIVALASRETPIVIFVDDLDRCGPETVAATVDAIELFLSDAFGDCVFVLALDPTTVAAQLAGAQTTLPRRLGADGAGSGQARHVGWRLLEKLITLPVRLPGLTASCLGGYLDELTGARPLGAPPPPAPAPRPPAPRPPARPTGPFRRAPVRVPRPRLPADDLPPPDRPPPDRPAPADPAVETVPRGGGPVGRPRPPADEGPTPRTDGIAGASAVTAAVTRRVAWSPAETAAQIDYVEQIRDVRRELRRAALALPRRGPRQAERVVNLWRFYMSVEYRCGRLPEHFRELARHGRAMARFVGMLLRFPALLDSVSDPSPTEFRRFVAAAAEEQMWHEQLVRCRLSPVDPAVEELRELLRDPTGSPELLAEIGERYL
ncbi:WD40 repeat [Micromonospora pattaloongensis]|uniref:WD40 repeat n=1 Tax=Micromonospora pattaloongensis TaxID=405436 RepID=A0A1H3STN5_9ACTN|nr:P-loop NTPase fold protein [Micromonospora pattaloongensis]SDZ40489.1 WD40 repeat [Micromonospora pattaloongensis]